MPAKRSSVWDKLPEPRYPLIEVLWADPQKQTDIDIEGAQAEKLFLWRSQGRLVKRTDHLVIISQDQGAEEISRGDVLTIDRALVRAIRVVEP